MSAENKQKFTEKLKTDKKFRFEFIVGIWSGLIACTLLVALIFIAKIYFFSDKSIDSDEVADETPAVVTEQAVEPEKTDPPYDKAIINGNEEDFEDDEDDEETEGLKTAKTAYATTVVNLRSEPSLTASVIAKVAAGDEVDILEYGKEWTKVSYDGKEGYISTIYLSTSKPVSEPMMTPKVTTTTPKPTVAPKATKPPKPKKTKKPKQPVKTQKPVKTQEPTDPPKPTTVPTEPPKPTPAPTDPPKPTQAPTEPPQPTPDQTEEEQ